MLVAAEVRGELARIQPARACCRRAELVGLTYHRPGASLATLDPATARVGMRLSDRRTAPPAPTPGPDGAHRHRLRVPLPPDSRDWDWSAAPACDRRSFLRGVLLGAGSLSFGPGSGHVEFVLDREIDARRLQSWLAGLDIRAGRRQRRGRAVVYLKGLEHIATLLQVTGANHALLELEQERVAGEVRGRLNRVLNAEAANVSRTLGASERQLAAISALERSGELQRLPHDLQESARMRRRAPDADLATLAAQQGIGRSALNHRLRRLVSLAAQLGA